MSLAERIDIMVEVWDLIEEYRTEESQREAHNAELALMGVEQEVAA